MAKRSRPRIDRDEHLWSRLDNMLQTMDRLVEGPPAAFLSPTSRRTVICRLGEVGQMQEHIFPVVVTLLVIAAAFVFAWLAAHLTLTG